jgi:hypothetical protein
MKKLLIILFVLGTTQTQANPQSHLRDELKLQLKAGDQYKLTVDYDQQVSQEMMGQKVEVLSRTKTEYLYEFVSQTAQQTTIYLTYTHLYLHMDLAGMQTVTFDSKNPETSSPELAGMKDLLNRKLTVTYNNQGKVLDIKGFEGIASSGSEVFQGGEEASKQGIKQIIEQITGFYPGKTVNVGDTWASEQSGEMANIMQATSKINYSYKGKQGNNQALDVKGSVQLTPLSNQPALQGAQFNLKGTYTGQATMDASTGMIVDHPYEQNISGNIEVQGMSIPFNLVGKGRIYSQKL